jgi:two-component system, response regulator YesN
LTGGGNIIFKVSFFKSGVYINTLIIKISAFAVVLTLSLSVFLYFNFRNYAFEIIHNSNKKLLTQIGNSTLEFDRYSREYAHSLFTNSSASGLMLTETISVYDELNYINELDDMILSAPFIHSVYFYNGKRKTFYAMGKETIKRKKNLFYDKQILDIFESLDKKTLPEIGWNPKPRILNPPSLISSSPENVYTYVLYERLSDNQTIQNALVMNIRANWIINTMASESINPLPEGRNILIVDTHGNVIGNTVRDMFLRNISDEQYFNRIKASDSASGFFYSSMGNEKSLVTYVTPKYSKWTFISITPFTSVADTVFNVRRITVFIGLLMVFLGLVFAFVLSRNLYSPIDVLLKKIKQSLGDKTSIPVCKNEFDYISSNISSAQVMINTLETFKEKNISNVKQTFLRRALLYNLPFIEGNKDRSEELDLKVDIHSPLRIILLKIDYYRDFRRNNNVDKQFDLKCTLAETAGRLISSHYSNETVIMHNDHVVVLMNCENENKNDSDVQFMQNIKTIIKNMQKSSQEKNGISFSSFISERIDFVDSIGESYKTILDLSNFRIIYGHGCILTHHDIEKRKVSSFDISDNSINNLLKSLKLANLKQIKKHLGTIISQLYHCEYNNIQLALAHLTSSIFNVVNLIEDNSVISFDIDFETFNNKISSLETLEEIKEEYQSLFESIVDWLNDKRDDRHSILVSNIIQYIDENYHQTNLSLKQIAGEFNLTAAYINKIFREHQSKSIFNYISELRLNKAKDLLCSTDYKIQEIIKRVGWENKKYFYTSFKKCFGTTPTQYRLKNSIDTV